MRLRGADLGSGLQALNSAAQAIWGNLADPLYDGFRALCSKNRHVLNYFRMWTQHFTGYRLFSMELAQGKLFPVPARKSERGSLRVIAANQRRGPDARA